MTEEKVREVALKLNPQVNLHFGHEGDEEGKAWEENGFDYPANLLQVVTVMGWDGAMRLPDVLAFMGRLAIVMEELTNG